MKWDNSILESKFSHPANSTIVRFIEEKQPSAHSDVTEEMLIALKNIPLAHSYCPDRERFSYELLYTDAGIIFALALGQAGILFKIPDSLIESAIADGARKYAPLDSNWLLFDPFVVEKSTVQSREIIKRWCNESFAYAITTGAT